MIFKVYFIFSDGIYLFQQFFFDNTPLPYYLKTVKNLQQKTIIDNSEIEIFELFLNYASN